MRKLLTGIVLGLMAPAALSAQLDGKWEGAISLPGIELTITVEFNTVDGTIGATIDIPQQGAFGLALDSVVHDHPSIDFQLPTPIGAAIFSGTHTGDAIEGTFSQAGQEGTFRVIRGGEPEVQPDLPYLEEDFTFFNGEIRLEGTFTVPPGDGPFPAIVMITGSGPQNRDEELFGFKPFRIIADHLTRNGIAVLRYDDRGVGGSTGNVAEATGEDFAADVLAGISLLGQDHRISADRIGVLGHSEGGLVGPLAASLSDDVAFVIALAGPALNGAEILELQGALIMEADGESLEARREQLEAQRMVFRAIRTDEGWDAVDSALTTDTNAAIDAMSAAQRDAIPDREQLVRIQVQQQINQLQSKWFRHFIDYDPRGALRNLRVPLLALFGELDLQVPATPNADEMRAILTQAGHPDFTIQTYESANHLFIPALTGSPSEYATLEKVFVPGLLNQITTWTLERVR